MANNAVRVGQFISLLNVTLLLVCGYLGADRFGFFEGFWSNFTHVSGAHLGDSIHGVGSQQSADAPSVFAAEPPLVQAPPVELVPDRPPEAAEPALAPSPPPPPPPPPPPAPPADPVPDPILVPPSETREVLPQNPALASLGSSDVVAPSALAAPAPPASAQEQATPKPTPKPNVTTTPKPKPATTTKKPATTIPPLQTYQWDYKQRFSNYRTPKWDKEEAKKYSFYAGETGSAWIEDVINDKDPLSAQFEECLKIPPETTTPPPPLPTPPPPPTALLPPAQPAAAAAAAGTEAPGSEAAVAVPPPPPPPPPPARQLGGSWVSATPYPPCPLEVVALQVREEVEEDEEEEGEELARSHFWEKSDRRHSPKALVEESDRRRWGMRRGPNGSSRAPASAPAATAAAGAAAEAPFSPAAPGPRPSAQSQFIALGRRLGKPKPAPLTDEQRAWAKSLLTTAECQEAFGSNPGVMHGGRKTCRLQNAWVTGLKITGHFLAGELPPKLISRQEVEQIHSGTATGAGMKFDITEHKDIDDFYRWLKSPQGNYTHMPGQWAAFAPLWHFNPGHALFDGLYPIFVSMMLWGLQDAQFTFYLLCGGCSEAIVEKQLPGSYATREKIYAKFAGLGSLRSGDAPPIGLMDDVVFGIGNNGQKTDHSVNVTLGACRELDACRVFRDRMYKQYGMDPPAPSSSRLGQQRKAILIENKRFVSAHLTRALAAVKADPELAKVDIAQISWSSAKQRQTGDFVEHLEIIRDTDIHLSGPGTGMMYQTFLPDGAVHINLGTQEGNCPRSYMEEYMAEGSPYLHALYNIYPSSDLIAPVIVELTKKAYNLLEENHPLPIPVGQSLSPVGLVFKAYIWRRYRGTEEEHSLRIAASLKTIQGAPTNGNNNFFEKWTCYASSQNTGNSRFTEKKDVCLMKALRTSFDQRFPNCGPHGKGWFLS